MYCRKCGKMVEDDKELCVDCQEMDVFFGDEQAKASEKVETVAPKLEGSRKTGMAKGLVGTILGAVAYFIACVGFGLISGALEVVEEEAYLYDSVEQVLKELNLYGGTVFCAVVPLLMFVPSLVLGILSISCFKCEKNAGRVKPIPTLVLGIVSVVLAALNVLFSLCTFAMLAL